MARRDQRGGLIDVLDVSAEQDQTRYSLSAERSSNLLRWLGAIESAHDYAARRSF
jgi:hypothetical protein